MDDWIASSSVQEVSRQSYKRKAMIWFRFIAGAGRDVKNVSAQDVVDYKDRLMADGKTAYSVNGYLTAIRSLYRYMQAKGYWTDVTKGIQNVKVQKYYHKIPLTETQVNTLLSSIDLTGPVGRRDRLMILLMILNGLRGCEVARINIEDFDKEYGRPVLRVQRKGRLTKDAVVPIEEEIIEALEDYLADRTFENSEPLFITYNRGKHGKIIRITPRNIDQIIKARLRKVGIDDARITTHSLRHTFGTLMVRAGVSIDDIQELMGHTTCDTTRIYIKLEKEQRLLQCSPIGKMKNLLMTK